MNEDGKEKIRIKEISAKWIIPWGLLGWHLMKMQSKLPCNHVTLKSDMLQILMDSTLTASIFDDIVFFYFPVEGHPGPFKLLSSCAFIPIGFE